MSAGDGNLEKHACFHVFKVPKDFIIAASFLIRAGCCSPLCSFPITYTRSSPVSLPPSCRSPMVSDHAI